MLSEKLLGQCGNYPEQCLTQIVAPECQDVPFSMRKPKQTRKVSMFSKKEIEMMIARIDLK